MFKYNFESFKTRMLWYVRQLLPLKYSFKGEINPDGVWRPASCTWRQWFGVPFHIKWDVH